MTRSLLLAALVAASSAAADPATLPLPGLTNIAHGDLVAALSAQRGEALFASKITPDGRRVEFFTNQTAPSPSNPYGCAWTLVVTWRPTGSVNKASPAQIIGEGDPGVCIPPL